MKPLNPNIEKLLNLGKDSINNVNYKELGLTSENTQELLDIIVNDTLHFSNQNSNYPYAPIHAIYTLAKLEIEEPFDTVSKLVKDYDDDYLANAIVDYAKELNCLNKINSIQDFHKALNRKVKEDMIIPEAVITEEPKVVEVKEDIIIPEAIVTEEPKVVEVKEDIIIPEPVITEEAKEEVIIIESDELIKEAINEMHEKDSDKVIKGRAPVKQPVKHIKIGRNDLCPCGSGKKYKKCCINS